MIKSLEKDAKKDHSPSSATAVREPVLREVKDSPKLAAVQAKPDSAKPAGKPSADKVASDPSRDSALSRAVQQIEKQFGKGSVMKLDGDARTSIDGIATGSLGLDIALGGNGVPRGRIIEIFGPESSGKTTLTLHIIANAQKAGGVAAFIDAEHALDPSWAKRIGIKLDDLLVSQPDTGEQALEICELLVRSNAVDVIVIDSVAALIPRAEIEGEMGDSHMGLQARLMSQAMRKLTGAIAKSRSTVIFINQIREKIGVMFGNPETTPGGRALQDFTPASASTSTASAPSKTPKSPSAAAPAPALSKTKSLLHSAMPNSTSCSTAASATKATSSISPFSPTSSKRAGRGSIIKPPVLARAARMRSNSFWKTRT